MQNASFRQLRFRSTLAIVLPLTLFASANCVCANNSTIAPPATTLVTQLGDRLPGHWIAADHSESIQWQVPGFVQPFQIEISQLASIQIQHASKIPPIEGSYRCELVGGDVLYGNPLALDDAELLFELPGSGTLKIERSRLRKLSPRLSTGEKIVTTPSTLSDWEDLHLTWQEAAGRMTALEDLAKMVTKLPFGNKSQMSLHIAWEGSPNFRIDFGSSDSSQWNSGFRLETWQNQLVLVAESSEAAEVLRITKTTDQPGELSLNVFLDTDKQQVLVTTESGERLGQFDWKEKLGSHFRIFARKKNFHFYSATIMPWDGALPESLDMARSSVRYKNGKIENATPTAWDPKTKKWTLAFESASKDNNEKTEPIERQVSSDEIVSIFFAENPSTEAAGATEAKPGSVQAVSRTAMRFLGDIVKLREDAIELRCRGVKDPIVLPLASLQSLVFLEKPEESKPVKFSRLRMGDASMGGQLVQGKGNDQATALVWKPTVSQTASALSHKASGSITYRVPSPPKKKNSQPPQRVHIRRNNGFLGGIGRLLTGPRRSHTQSKKSTQRPLGSTLYLRSGDSIPCQPKRIDSEGLTFTSTVTDATFAPLESIKALVLVGGFKPAKITLEKRDRLLTLPRIQQKYPPTHLLLSVDGDLLRTRVTAMDDQYITSEVRLNATQVPRDRVAAIAWLHQDESQKDEDEDGNEDGKAQPSSSPSLLHVQAVQSDGIRLTFRPQAFADGVLSGKSEVFGNCQVEVAEVDQLLFGQAIEEFLKKQGHQRLTLKPAMVPRFITEEGSSSTDAGQSSVLVGKEAPPIRLKNIDGSKFDLADHRGKIVVVDFWATWCGPCIQWMPQLEKIVADYPNQQVELVSINLLQEKEVVQSALERMQIKSTALLDLDGVVSDAYQATAIPQTVIIDQQGKVVRLFVGDSKQLQQSMKEALDTLTGKAPAKANEE